MAQTRVAAPAPAITFPFQPAEADEEEDEEEETDASPPFKDTSRKLPSIGQKLVTWPYLAAKEDGKCQSHSGWLKTQGAFSEEGEVTDTEATRSHGSLVLVSDFRETTA